MYDFKVGYARHSISPLEPCPLSGFGSGRNRISNRIMDELYASCIALTDAEGSTVLLFSLDQQRPQEEVIAEIRAAVTEASGIAADKIMVCSTHTHSTPDLYMTDMPAIPRYRAYMAAQCAKAAVDALNDRKSATFQAGSMDTEHLNFIKHYKQANGSFCGDNFGDANASPIVGHASQVYSRMHIIKILREGCKDLVVCNFRSHPTMTGGTNKLEVSSDFVGPFRDSVERQKNCDFVFFQGACGNINPRSRIKEENVVPSKDYYAYGAMLGNAAIRLLDSENMKAVEAGKLQSRQINYDCPIDHSRDCDLDKAREVVAYWHSTAPKYDFAGSRKLALSYDFSSAYHAMAVIGKSRLAQSENVEIDVVTIGDQLAFVTAPGELFDSISVEMERLSPFPMSMTLGYANGDRKYFVHGVGYTYRSYESDYARCVPGTSEKIVEMWVETLREFYKNS